MEMSFFSSTVFLRSVASAHFPGKPWRIEEVHVAGRTYRLLVVGKDYLISSCPFLDFFEPLEDPADGAAVPPSSQRQHPYLPRVCLGEVSAAAWARFGLAEHFAPAPYIDWSAVESWDAFLASVHTRTPYPFKINNRKRRRIAREIGPLRVELHDNERQLLELCMRWKSHQYKASKLWDIFAVEQNCELFFALLREGALAMQTLYAGDRPLAIHVGTVWNERFYYWLPAHDPEASIYSPGSLLLEHLLETSFANLWQFDFLLGGEPYKWSFATHTRLIGPAGQEQLSLRLWRSLRSVTVAGIRRQPQLYGILQSMKRRLKEKALL